MRATNKPMTAGPAPYPASYPRFHKAPALCSAPRVDRPHPAQAWRAAEAETKCNMLHRRGREAHIDGRSLFTGPESRARKYASEELLARWEWNPRPTEGYFQGEDSRIGYGRHIGVRRPITSEEQAWRERYEHAERVWPERAA